MSTTSATLPSSSRRGRPVLGGVSGFFLGLFSWVDLVLLDVIAFESVSFWIFPILGVAVGIGLAMWAPFGAGPLPATSAGRAPTADDAVTPASGLAGLDGGVADAGGSGDGGSDDGGD